jgi:Trypsin
MRRCSWFYAVVGAVVATSTAAPLSAGTMRHDVPEQAYVDYGDSMRLVGGLTVFPSFGTGVAISRDWVLTAAHVVAGADQYSYASFETDPSPDDPELGKPDGLPLSGFFYADMIEIHPFYNDVLGPGGGFDIALVHLNEPIPQYTPYPRFRGNPAANPELGRIGTAVGFGAMGTGITGYDVDSAGMFRLAGDNVIDGLATDLRMVNEFVPRTVVDPKTGRTLQFTREQIASQFMLSDFDGPASDGVWTSNGLNSLGSAVPLAMEYEVAPGDSGGPLFTLVDGQYQVMGINSFIDALPRPDGDDLDDASYSDLSGYLRVSMFNDWIDEVTGIPEPSSLLVLGTASIILMRRRRQEGYGGHKGRVGSRGGRIVR